MGNWANPHILTFLKTLNFKVSLKTVINNSGKKNANAIKYFAGQLFSKFHQKKLQLNIMFNNNLLDLKKKNKNNLCINLLMNETGLITPFSNLQPISQECQESLSPLKNVVPRGQPLK